MVNCQSIIQRFTVQSFGIKALSLTFLGLVYSTYVESNNPKNACVLLICILVFAFLDAYYLKMERVYIEVEKDIEKNGFKGYSYEKYNILNVNILKSLFSKTIAPLYFIEFIIVLVPVTEITLQLG